MIRAALGFALALWAASAGAVDLTVLYLSRAYEEPLPLSLVESIPEDKGVAGARLAQQENALTGRFTGFDYALEEHLLPLDAPFTESARAVAAGGPKFIVAALDAADLLAFADLPEAADDIVLNVRAPDDRLRTDDCRPNMFHVAPSYRMKADGLAQYLVWKRWMRWLLVRGQSEADRLYAEALSAAADKFGAEIVESRAYEFEAGSRRVESGHQQIQTQMPMLTQSAPDHDVLVVADVDETFGEYLLYRTWDARPVVGTHGLVSVAWHRAFEQFGSMSHHSAFRKLADREITEADHLSWLGVKTFSEAALRAKSADPAVIRARLLAPDFVVPGFKGIGLSFRTWNQQMRMPLLIAWHRALVSMSPQDTFLHERHALDSLGFDLRETRCRLNPGD